MKKEFIINENLTKQLLTDDRALNGFISELQAFLKTKLEPCENEKGVTDYWTCGIDHLNPPPRYEPYKNFMKFCTKKHLDWEAVKERIEKYAHANNIIHCECFIVNRLDLKEV
jgi:hypothetical protein